MNLIAQGFAWIFDPAHWYTTSESVGIGPALAQHLILTALSLLLTILVAVPLGFYIGHTGRGRTFAIRLSNVARAVPSLGLLTLLVLLVPDFPGIPYLYVPLLIVFTLLGIPPMLAGAYSGLESVNRETIDSARAVGMTEWQILFKVEVPLAAGLIMGGLRATTLQIVATVTIASLIGPVTLGTFITDGLEQGDYVKMTAGAIMVAALALILDGLLALAQRFAVPRGVSRRTGKYNTTARGSKSAAAPPRTPVTEGT